MIALAIETPPDVVRQRMQTGQIAAVVLFVALAAAIAAVARWLGRRAAKAEEEQRIARAFRELEKELEDEP